MSAQLLERAESATTWLEAPADLDVGSDDNSVTFVLFGTTAGHPRTMLGDFDDRWLYWQGVSHQSEAKLYEFPSIFPSATHGRTADTQQLQSPSDNVKALRNLTGLTWDQIARLFGVSRRAVHLWAAGGNLSAANEELLAEVVDIVEAIDAPSPDRVRHELFRARPTSGLSLYDEIRSRHASTAADINRTAGSAY